MKIIGKFYIYDNAWLYCWKVDRPNGNKRLEKKKRKGGGKKAITALSLAAKEFLYFGPMNNIGRK